MNVTLGVQLIWLVVLAVPIACVAWTVTHEEVFREPRDFCIRQSEASRQWYTRKFFYLFTCEYCFSHYVAAAFLLATHYHLLMDDWRGSVIAWFSLVWIANQYMSIFNRLRLVIKDENINIQVKEEQLESSSKG